MLRHMRSLRKMDRDHGWIHTLLEEAENERMHLLTFLKLRQPGTLFRFSVIATQASPLHLARWSHPGTWKSRCSHCLGKPSHCVGDYDDAIS